MNGAVHALYDTLARYEWWRRRRDRGAMELRKRLAPAAAAPADSGEAFDRWLFDMVRPADGATVVDFGCGFGASLLRWVEWTGGAGIGVTGSPFQAARLLEVAARRGLGSRVRVLVQDFAAPIDVRADVVLAIEAFGHAADLDAVLANVHASLGSGGTLVWVEDLLARELRDDADVQELARRWSSPPLRDRAGAAAAAARTGLPIRREVDLTARVAAGDAAAVARRAAQLARWRAMVPFRPWHRLADAFLGGCALERLYARGEACYVARLCDRVDAP
ncbi:MAG: class I SAM-dependent methyltransferase [Planctomycetota bacterium]